MEVITITSEGQDPSKFISNFTNVIKLCGDYEVGLLKIAHPPIINISDSNNRIYIKDKTLDKTIDLVIPNGFYDKQLMLYKQYIKL